jgi:hypothetical protein
MFDLSLLIAHIPERREVLNSLLTKLNSQVENDLRQRVEIIILEDDFRITIGCKRNLLLGLATGKFVMFVDDDDTVHVDLCRVVCDIIRHKDVDYIGSKLKRSFTEKPEYRSITLNQKFEDEDGSYRAVSHTTPIRREIAVRFQFPSLNLGEDEDWCEQLRVSGLLQNEFFCQEFLYNQRHSTAGFTKEPASVPLISGHHTHLHLIDL